ncbi:MAG: PEP-CTERM sorting domain-containing protein [Desulfobacula sp.]|nr:PEP-CTERM sorting domain-containing protein [Desulfobacula sp.]
MLKVHNFKIVLILFFVVLSVCLHKPIVANASVIDQTVDGMSGFQIDGDTKVWLDITNPNIFGQTWGVMDAWATANGWRFATHAEFVELLLAIIPTGLYDSDNVSDPGHFNQNEVDIMGAGVADISGGPAGEIEYFTAYIDSDFDERHIGLFEQVDPSGLYHSFWGVDAHATEAHANANSWGYESALLIKEGIGNGGQIPEPTTMLMFGFGLLGLAGVSRRKK